MASLQLVTRSAVLLALIWIGSTAHTTPAFGGQSFTEDFTTTTYEDPVTTAEWDTTSAELRLPPFSPSLTGSYGTPGTSSGIAVDGSYAFVADGVFGLQILEISDPANPTLLGTFDTANLARDVAVSGDHAFVADQFAGMAIVDISDPQNPVLAGTYATPDFSRGVCVDGDLAFVADGSSGLHVVDISDPTNPSMLGSYDTPDNAIGVAVSGDFVFVTDQSSGLLVFDVSDPVNPSLIGTYETPGSAVDLALAADHAYVADSSAGLLVIDISDPETPSLAGSHATAGSAQDVVLDGDRVLIADGFSGLAVFDVQDPANPILSQTYGTGEFVSGVAVRGGHAWIANGSGVQAIRIQEPTAPFLAGSGPYALGDMHGLALHGDYAFVAGGFADYHLFEIEDPTSPVYLRSINAWGEGTQDLVVAGNLAFFAAGGAGLGIIDVTDPSSGGTEVAAYDTPGFARDVAVAGDFAFVADGGRLEVIDVSNPANPTLAGSYATAGEARAVVVAGNLALIADETGGALALDISDPTNPTLLGDFDPGSINDVALAGDQAYAVGTDGLYVLDITNPSNPVLLGTYSTPVPPSEVVVAGDRAYLATGATGLLVVDISESSNPVLAGSCEVPGSQLTCVEASGEYVFLGDDVHGLSVVRVSQSEVALDSAVGQSLELDGGDDAIPRVRLTASQTSGVSWDLTLDGGTQWSSVSAEDVWTRVTDPGADLRWRTTHTWSPGTNPTVSELTIDWRNEFGPIASIEDVPDDQGGRVYLRLTRSGYDFADEVATPVTQYGVYRRVDTSAPQFDRGTWPLVATVPATQSDSYLVEVTTDADSTASGGTDWSVYVVTTHTTTPSIWFASEPDSGYSVDNIAPGVPANLAYGDGTELDWSDAIEQDFQYYTVYGSDSPVFDETAVLIDYTVVPGYDVGGQPYDYFHVTTSDHAGNESGAASIGNEVSSTPDGPDGSEVAAPFAFRRAGPSPFRQSTALGFDLPREERVHLMIVDATGRKIRDLIDEPRPAGSHTIHWDGRREGGASVASGVYFARIRMGSFVETVQLVRVR